MFTYFTADQAAALFKEHTGYAFHATVPGQLLARRKVVREGYTEDCKAAYDGSLWEQLWLDMLALAKDRLSYEEAPVPFKETVAPVLPIRQDPLYEDRPAFDIHSKTFSRRDY